MKNIKMIVSDMDGTLLTNDKKITAHTAEILNKLREKGYLVVFASARPLTAISSYKESFSPDYIIANNGSKIIKGDEVIYSDSMKREDAQSILSEFFNEKSVEVIAIQSDTFLYVNDPIELGWGKEWGASYDDLSVLPEGECFQISTKCPNVQAIRDIVKKYPDFQLYEYKDEIWQQTMNRNATKLIGLEQLSKLVNIELSEMIAFGDDFNDMEMIKGVGVGVVMENGLDELKKHADHICKTNMEDGVAEFLKEKLL